MTMFSIKRELKLNNKQKSYLSGCAGYARFVYNMGLAMIKESWNFEGIKASEEAEVGITGAIFGYAVPPKLIEIFYSNFL